MILPSTKRSEMDDTKSVAGALLALVAVAGVLTISGQVAVGRLGSTVDPGSPDAAPPALFIQVD